MIFLGTLYVIIALGQESGGAISHPLMGGRGSFVKSRCRILSKGASLPTSN